MTAPLFSKNTISSTPTSPPHRFNPWRMFVGSMIPNWLQCRPEIGQGPKLAYARLAQYAGEDGKCFPKQTTLAAELGVSERMVNEYIRTLVKFGLIEKERHGLGKPNHYHFLDHPWIYERRPETTLRSNQQRQKASGSIQKKSSGQETQQTSVPYNKEIQKEESPEKRLFPHNPPKGDCENTSISCSLAGHPPCFEKAPFRVTAGTHSAFCENLQFAY
jgi:Helix-turn-helix domain